MKKTQLFVATLAFAVVFPLVSCGKSSVSWDFSPDKLENSIIVPPAVIKDDDELVIKLEGEGIKFNSDKISNSTVIVHSDMIEAPKNVSPIIDIDDKEVITNIDQLMAQSIPNCALNVSKYGDAMYIAIPKQYKESNMNIVLHPSCTNIGEYIATETFTGKLPDYEVEPYLESAEEVLKSGEKDPQFRFAYLNLGQTHNDKIAFDGSLSDLQVDNVIYGPTTFLIKTKGTVKSEEAGYVVFKSGFCDKLDTDLHYTYKTELLSACADRSSLQIHEKGGYYQCEFDVYFSDEIGNIGRSNVSIENPGSLVVEDVCIDYLTYKAISIKVSSSIADPEGFISALANASFRIHDDKKDYIVNIDCEKPTFYTEFLPYIGEQGENLMAILSIDNGYFDGINKLKKEDISIENGPEFPEDECLKKEMIKSVELTDDGCYVITFDTGETAFNYTRGEITFNNLHYYSNAVDSDPFIDSVKTSFYYNESEIEGNTGRNLNARANATAPQPEPVEEVYEDVVKDKFPWQLGVKFANILVTAGAAFMGCESAGQAAATAIGLLLSIADAIGDITNDPIASIMTQLQIIDGKLDIISRQLAKLAQDMQMAHSEMYHGIKMNTYLLYRNSWLDFNKRITEFEELKREYRGVVTGELRNWLIGTSQEETTREIKLNFSAAENEGKTMNFNQVFQNYDARGNISTDNTNITSSVTVKITDVSNVLPKTLANNQYNYSKDFAKTFEDEIVTHLKNKPKFAGNITIEGEAADQYKTEIFGNKQGDELEKMQHLFARSLLYSLLDKGGKTYFPNDGTGQTRANKIANSAINFFDDLSGNSPLGGTGARFYDFYNMLYNKYSFQSEAEKPLKIFRTKLRKIMYDYAAFAHNGLTLFPSSLRDDLKESCEKCEKVFMQEDGLKDTMDYIKKTRSHVLSCDYCYVTGTFVSMNIVKNRTEAVCRDGQKQSYGARSTSWISQEVYSRRSVTWKQINLTTLSFVNEQKLRWAFERCALNGLAGNKTMYEYLKSLTVARIKNDHGIEEVKFLPKTLDDKYEGDKTNPALLTSYEGLQKVTNNATYNPPGLTGTVTKKICGKYCPSWTKIGAKVDLYFKNRDRSYYHIWRGVGNVVALNNPSLILRDNIGHAWWLAESHWYWVFTGDEFWGVEEFTNETQYFALINI